MQRKLVMLQLPIRCQILVLDQTPEHGTQLTIN